ncbi:MAG: hypothetical protein AAF806_24250 [Bacteroidota bacterium]
MRLPILYEGLSPLQKVQTFFIHKVLGFLPGPILILSYRKRFLGKHFARLIHQVLRKAKHWSVAELELFGAFVSAKNACQMCTSDHQAVASQAMDVSVIKTVLEDYKNAPVGEHLRVTLAFLEKLSLQPHKLTYADLQPMKDIGLSNEVIVEAAEVCMTFAIMNRLVDAFGFEVGGNPEKTGSFLFKNGYKIASLMG